MISMVGEKRMGMSYIADRYNKDGLKTLICNDDYKDWEELKDILNKTIKESDLPKIKLNFPKRNKRKEIRK